MAIDDDLSALLPDAPPPRPARREAAIGEALRRFDGEPAPARPGRAAPARTGWGRPQVVALASVALVVLVSVPVWWAERDRIVPQAPPRAAATTAPASPAQASRVSASPLPAQAPRPSASIAAPAPPTEPAAPASPAAIESNLDRLPQFAPAARGEAAAPADARAARETSLAQMPAAPPPPAPAQRAPAARAEADAADRIVVTGALRQRQDYEATTPVVTVDETVLEARGAWSACTLRDPDRDLAACRAFADPAARGAAGRAGAQLADGLMLGWQGDLDGAIAAFTRALGADPDLSIAYLNRGLAWQQKGDMRRALADLDRAVDSDRGSARAYYYRSLLHRQRGDAKRAEADARRAVARDSR